MPRISINFYGISNSSPSVQMGEPIFAILKPSGVFSMPWHLQDNCFGSEIIACRTKGGSSLPFRHGMGFSQEESNPPEDHNVRRKPFLFSLQLRWVAGRHSREPKPHNHPPASSTDSADSCVPPPSDSAEELGRAPCPLKCDSVRLELVLNVQPCFEGLIISHYEYF